MATGYVIRYFGSPAAITAKTITSACHAGRYWLQESFFPYVYFVLVSLSVTSWRFRLSMPPDYQVHYFRYWYRNRYQLSLSLSIGSIGICGVGSIVRSSQNIVDCSLLSSLCDGLFI